MQVPDSIRKELILAAPRGRVWLALTDPDQLVRWFPTLAAEVDLRPGGTLRFSWEDMTDEGIVDEVSPAERFVFSWRPEGSDRPYTRVTVTLHDLPDGGTSLVLVEEGFAALADDRRDEAIDGHGQGWTEELEELRALVETVAA